MYIYLLYIKKKKKPYKFILKYIIKIPKRNKSNPGIVNSKRVMKNPLFFNTKFLQIRIFN